MRSHLIALCCTVSFAPSLVMARSDVDDLLALDLEDLIKVSVASKKEETVAEAPGIISIVTSEDIKRFGGNNLMDVLGRVTSIQNYDTAAVFENGMSIRGQSIQHYTSRILFLIDGRPIRDSIVSGFNESFFKRFPLTSIERIEIIRGPGSVLYGSTAFSGVVNIITRFPEEGADPVNEVNVKYGSFGTRTEEVYFSRAFDDLKMSFAANNSNVKGHRRTLILENGSTGTIKAADGGYGFSTRFDYKGLHFQSYYGRTSYDNVDSRGARYEYSKKYMYDLGYTYDITDDWQASVNVTRNGLIRPYRSTIGLISDDVITEATVSGTLPYDINLLVGSTYENHDGEQIGQKYQTQWYSGYLQADYRLIDSLKLIVGAQVNKVKRVKKHISPRYGAIFNIDDNWGVKLLHSEAFRSGVAAETDANLPGILIGNKALKPELIATSEAQLFYENTKLSGSTTYYHSNVTNVIGRVPHPSGGLTLGNQGENTFDGIELEGKWKYNKNLNFIGNATYQRNQRNDGIADSTFTPNLMAKLGVSYKTDEGHSLGIFDNYFGKPTAVRDLSPAVSEVNPPAESYHFVSANMRLNVNDLIDKKNWVPITFSLFVDNVLDEDIYYPEFNRQRINTYPLHTGRAYFGTLSVKF